MLDRRSLITYTSVERYPAVINDGHGLGALIRGLRDESKLSISTICDSYVEILNLTVAIVHIDEGLGTVLVGRIICTT
jgi:hypothetical protein